MKKNLIAGFMVFLVSCSLLLSCKLSTEDLAKQVQEHMIETWEENGIDLEITKDLVLVKKAIPSIQVLLPFQRMVKRNR